MAEEVKIRITADDQATKPVLDAVRAEQEFGLAAQQAGELSSRAAAQQSASKQDLRARLEELVRAQDAYLQAIREGAAIDQSEVAIAEAREDQIRRITDELGREVNIQAEMTRRVREAAEAQRAATAVGEDAADQAGVIADATSRQADAAVDLKARLAELTRQQDLFVLSVRGGMPADEDAITGAEQREREISRLQRTLSLQTSTEKAAEEAGKRSDRTLRDGAEGASLKDRAIAALGENVLGLIARLTALGAVGGTVVQVFKDIERAARAASAAVEKVGEDTRPLSANIGGAKAADIFAGVTALSAESGFNVAGRGQLLEAVSAMTDVRPDMSSSDIMKSAANLALLQRGTGVGGREGFATVQTMMANLNLTEEQAVDRAAVLLNGGFDAQGLRDIVERSGTRGGEPLLGAIYAARRFGLDPNKVSRQLPTLIDNLGARDDGGALTPELQAAGVQEGQTIIQSLQAIRQAVASGQITQAQADKILGGASSARLVDPLLRAVAAGADQQAMAELADPNAAEEQVKRILANPYARAQERQNTRDLLVQSERETPWSTAARRGEVLAQQDAETADLPGVVKFVAGVGNLPNYLIPGAVQEDDARNRSQILQNSGARGNASPSTPTVVNVTNMYVNGEPRLTAPNGRRD